LYIVLNYFELLKIKNWLAYPISGWRVLTREHIFERPLRLRDADRNNVLF